LLAPAKKIIKNVVKYTKIRFKKYFGEGGGCLLRGLKEHGSLFEALG
jgi:hypothetical protein